MQMPEQETETRELLCELTQAELLSRGSAMAEAELRIEQLKLKRGEVSDAIKVQRAVRRKLAGVIDAGKELRDVRCVWIAHFTRNCFELVRQDTGEVVDTRAMTAEERQEDMDFEPERSVRRHVDSEPVAVSAKGKRFDA
jgi:hypothetical protein